MAKSNRRQEVQARGTTEEETAYEAKASKEQLKEHQSAPQHNGH